MDIVDITKKNAHIIERPYQEFVRQCVKEYAEATKKSGEDPTRTAVATILSTPIGLGTCEAVQWNAHNDFILGKPEMLYSMLFNVYAAIEGPDAKTGSRMALKSWACKMLDKADAEQRNNSGNKEI